MDAHALEWIAQSLADEHGLLDPLDLAAELGVIVIPGPRAGCHGDTIIVPASLPPRRQRGLVAHELGHWLLRREGCDSEAGARYLSGALRLPRRELRALVRRHGLGVPALLEAVPWASAEALCWRLHQVLGVPVRAEGERGRVLVALGQSEAPARYEIGGGTWARVVWVG